MNTADYWPSRAEGQTPDKTGRPDEPWWTRAAITWMEGYLKPDMRVLEWGAGASTVWLAKRVKYLCTIEHDQEWTERVKSVVDPLGWFEIKNIGLGSSYIDAVGTQCDSYASFFDVVIVDGRLRVFCAERAMRHLRSGGVLLFDNAQEEKYAEVHELLRDWPVMRTDNGIWRTDIFTKP